MFATADVVVTQAPIHLDEGLVPWCYSKPVSFYEQLDEHHGCSQLPWYWGQLAGSKSSEMDREGGARRAGGAPSDP